MRPNIEEIRELLAKTPTDEWRCVGEHTDDMGNTSSWIVAGDYANEGEPDLVIEVWGTEDDKAYAEFVSWCRDGVSALLTYIDELENMPLVQTVVKLQGENEVLRESMHQALGGYMSMCPECDGLLPKHADGCALLKALEGDTK